MLKWNHDRVKNLSPTEIWLFIIGRVFAGFGLGILAVIYFPTIFSSLGIPALIIGLGLMVFAGKGLRKKPL